MTATGTITADGVRFERIYDATPDELWRAITDPEQIRGWLAHTTRWTLAPGEEWSIRFDDGRAGVIPLPPAKDRKSASRSAGVKIPLGGRTRSS